MRALQLKTQWTRSNAAAQIDAATQAIASRTFQQDIEKADEHGDPRLRRRANVFVIPQTMTASLLDRVRVILPHVLLFVTTVLYGILGAVCFSYTEQGYETGHMSRYSKNAIAAQNALLGLNIPKNSFDLSENDRNQTEEEIEAAIDRVIQTAMEAFSEGMQALDISHDAVQKIRKPKWTFQAALYFVVTILTSVGYGNLVPISRTGRIFCIIYGTFGIPLTLITIADMAKFLSDMIAKLEAKYRKKRQKKEDDEKDESPKKKNEDKTSEAEEDDEDLLIEPGPWSKAFVLFLLLAYMALSALGCSVFTDTWNFLDSFYFCLITMTTIGFGDLDPALAYDPPDHYAGWICFIFAGLILSTLTVDLCGSSAIDRIHRWGTRLDVLAMFSTLTKGGKGQWLAAFQPAEYSEFPWIDQRVRLSMVIENGVTYENSVGKISDSGTSTNRS